MHTGLMREYAANVSSPLSAQSNFVSQSTPHVPSMTMTTAPQASLLATQVFGSSYLFAERNYCYTVLTTPFRLEELPSKQQRC